METRNSSVYSSPRPGRSPPRVAGRVVPGAALGALLLTMAPRAGAQALRDRLPELFIFPGTSAPLGVFRPVDPSNPSAGAVETDVFVPGSTGPNGAVLEFLLTWMNGTVASIPQGTTAAGTSFSFGSGAPEPTSVSQGPPFVERAFTVGRRRLVTGVSVSRIRYSSVRGTSMRDLRLAFTSRCATAGSVTSCSTGDEATTGDVLAMRLGVTLDLSTASAFATYGVTDRFDVAVVVPGVRASLSGESQSTIVRYDGQPATVFLGGTAAAPVRTATRRIGGDATGLGDVMARGKLSLFEGPATGLALVGEARFGTGDEANLLGSGYTAYRTALLYTTLLNRTTPTVAVGYQTWRGGPFPDALLVTTGVDHQVNNRLTVAGAVLSELYVEDSPYRLPADVILGGRIVRPLDLPAVRDDALHASLGAKVQGPWGVGVVANAIVPVRRGGPRPDRVLSVGAERTF